MNILIQNTKIFPKQQKYLKLEKAAYILCLCSFRLH